MTEEQKRMALLALRAIATRAEMMAIAVEKNQLWAGDISDGVQLIHEDLAKVPRI